MKRITFHNTSKITAELLHSDIHLGGDEFPNCRYLELFEERTVPGPLHKPKQSLVSHFAHDAEGVEPVMFASASLLSLQAGQDLGTQLALILLSLHELV